jgi:hypothetical protein
MTLEITTAINKFEATLRHAVLQQYFYESSGEDPPYARIEDIWAKHKEARIELEALIYELISRIRD